MVKSIWNVRRTPGTVIVSAANSQERPNKNMMPARLIIRRMMVFPFRVSFLRAMALRVCLTKMTMTMMYTTELNRTMVKIGTKKVVKNAIGFLRKQLRKEK